MAARRGLVGIASSVPVGAALCRELWLVSNFRPTAQLSGMAAYYARTLMTYAGSPSHLASSIPDRLSWLSTRAQECRRRSSVRSSSFSLLDPVTTPLDPIIGPGTDVPGPGARRPHSHRSNRGSNVITNRPTGLEVHQIR